MSNAIERTDRKSPAHLPTVAIDGSLESRLDGRFEPRLEARHTRGPSSRAERGSAKIVILVLVLIAVVLGFVFFGTYNGLVTKQQKVTASWSQIDNEYKRRNDLVPNLVATVQGAADFEKSTLTAVTEARASVGRVQLPTEMPTDEKQLAAYIAAQQGLGAALGRLMVVAEAYPDLKSSAAFRDLQVQLEGTENRIAVARTDYIESVRDYNTAIAKLPGNLVAGLRGMKPAAQLTIPETERTVPKVDFGGGK